MHYLFQAHGAMASLESMQTKQFSRLSATVEYESLHGGGNGGAQGRSRTDGRDRQMAKGRRTRRTVSVAQSEVLIMVSIQ